jgi:uncharacterized protein YecE (DUF72 family)
MVSVLDRKLGPVLFQFPKSFRADRSGLENFLALIPRDMASAFEFRNPTWLNDEILDLLREKEASLCVADSDENPAHEIIRTAPRGYVRLRRSDYADADLSEWTERILSQEWEEAFVFFKHEDEDPVRGPQMAMRFQELIDSRVKKVETGRMGKAA